MNIFVPSENMFFKAQSETLLRITFKKAFHYEEEHFSEVTSEAWCWSTSADYPSTQFRRDLVQRINNEE